jgi:hypothetical protein
MLSLARNGHKITFRILWVTEFYRQVLAQAYMEKQELGVSG